jgi:hypothetical protein
MNGTREHISTQGIGPQKVDRATIETEEVATSAVVDGKPSRLTILGGKRRRMVETRPVLEARVIGR